MKIVVSEVVMVESALSTGLRPAGRSRRVGWATVNRPDGRHGERSASRGMGASRPAIRSDVKVGGMRSHATGQVRCELLGPFRFSHAGTTVNVGRPLAQAVLVSLLRWPDTVISADQLIE